MAWTVPANVASGTQIAAATTNAILADLAILSGTWTTYTPVLTGSTTNPTGYDTSGSSFIQANKLVVFRAVVTFAAGVGSGSYSLTLPAAPRNAGAILAQGCFVDTSTGALYPAYMLIGSGATTCTLRVLPTTAGNGLANATNTVPVTVATGDSFTFTGVYEAV